MVDVRVFADDEIYGDLFSAIIEQKLLPGARLKEDDLCDIYKAARSRIRKVLNRLSHDKVVTLVSNRGAFVAKPTVDEAHEVFTARRLVEGHLVRALAERAERRFREVLDRQIARERRARDDEDNAATIREGGAFHLVLAELADSPIIGGFLRELVSRTSLISAAYERGGLARCELDEHVEIIARIVEGRADEAVSLMMLHLDGIESRLDLAPPRALEPDLSEILPLRGRVATRA